MNNIDEIIERYLEEERDIGRTGPLRVFLGENEGENIPHFHVTNKEHRDSKRINTAIRLDINRYFIHGNKKDFLSHSELKELCKWLNAPCSGKAIANEEGKSPINNWENLVNTWNAYYPNAKVKTKECPNYIKMEFKT